jgi:hypothetical protein
MANSRANERAGSFDAAKAQTARGGPYATAGAILVRKGGPGALVPIAHRDPCGNAQAKSGRAEAGLSPQATYRRAHNAKICSADFVSEDPIRRLHAGQSPC